MGRFLVIVILLLVLGMVLWFSSPLRETTVATSADAKRLESRPSKSSPRAPRNMLGPTASLAAFHRLLEASREDGSSTYYLEFERAIAGLDLNDVRRIAREWLVDDEISFEHVDVLALLMKRWAVEEPREAWRAAQILGKHEAEKQRLDGHSIDARRSRAANIYTAVLRGWSQSDPEEVLRLLTDSRGDPIFTVMDRAFQVHRHVFADWTARDPEAAGEAVRRISGSARQAAVPGYLEGLPVGTDWHHAANEIPGLLREKPARDEAGFDLYFRLDARAATNQARQALAQSWMREDLSAALEWYSDLGEGELRGRDEEVIRADLVIQLLASRIDPSRTDLIRWVEKQSWKWPHSDEIPLRLLSRMLVYRDDIRPRLLRSVRSEQARFDYLVGLATGASESGIVADNWPEFEEAANLTSEHERVLRNIRAQREERSIDEILGDPDRRSAEERIRSAIEEATTDE